MLVELSNLPPLPELVHYAGRPGDWVTVSHGDVAPYKSHDLVFIPVCVHDVTGYYCVQMHKVFSGGRILSPTGFETLGGKEGNRKWRLSLRILMPNGHKGKTLGKYLVDHGLDHLVPKRASVSDGEECSPEKTDGNTFHETMNALRGRNTMPHVVTRPRRGRNALSASPVKKTSPMKKSGHARRRRTKSVDSVSLSSSKDQKEQRQVQINVQARPSHTGVGLPVVCSGTPVMVRHHSADMPRPLEQPSPPLGTWHVIRRNRHQDFFENDTEQQSHMGVSDYLDYNSLADYCNPSLQQDHNNGNDDDDADDDLLLHSFTLQDSEQPQ